jgi:hypothetical protein
MEEKEVTFSSSLFQFAQSQIKNTLILLPEEIEVRYSNPKLSVMCNKLKSLLNDLDSSEFITTQQAMQIIEPLVKVSEGELTISHANIGIVLNELMLFVFNSAMSKLASRGEVDTSWDIENNRVDFWIDVVGGE